MPSFAVTTPQRSYDAVVERGVLERAFEFVPPRAGALFVLTTADVWRLHGARLRLGRDPLVLFFPGGEERKRGPSIGEWQREPFSIEEERTICPGDKYTRGKRT